MFWKYLLLVFLGSVLQIGGIMNITIREPGSALTHFIAMMLALVASVPLLVKAAGTQTSMTVNALAIFMLSMVMLYTASTVYHSVTVRQSILKVFRKIDHMMIFVMIAGSYTPICLIVLGGQIGYTLLAVVWGIAIVGMLIKALWITCPKWFSSVLYISMGWVVVFVFGKILNTLPIGAFLWLLGGGVIYTIGGVLYAMKLKVFNNKHANFGSHEIFHLFVMGGSICHFVFMYLYVA